MAPPSTNWTAPRSPGKAAHPLTEAGVEDPHHQPQVRVEILSPQRGMEIAEVVLAGQGHGPGRLGLSRGERLGAQLGPPDDPDPGQLRMPGPCPAPPS
jgi:hypothetical protein